MTGAKQGLLASSSEHTAFNHARAFEDKEPLFLGRSGEILSLCAGETAGRCFCCPSHLARAPKRRSPWPGTLRRASPTGLPRAARLHSQLGSNTAPRALKPGKKVTSNKNQPTQPRNTPKEPKSNQPLPGKELLIFGMDFPEVPLEGFC